MSIIGFLLGQLAAFLYATTNHIDKHLLEKYFKEGGVGTLMIFSSLLSILLIPIAFIADPSIMSVSGMNLGVLACVAILNNFVLFFYLLALKDDEASVVVVFYQLLPVFGLMLGYLILGETISQMQMLAMAVILLGVSIISFEIDIENNFRLRKQTIFYMSLASFFWALETVIFKYAALEENVWRSIFWESVVMVLIGTLIFACIPTYRRHFLKAWKSNTKGILLLNVANEGIYLSANVAVAFAIMLAPVALILLTDAFQPIFVFLIGIILTIFFPKIAEEKIEAKHLIQKVLAILVTATGSYLLF